MLTEDKDFKKFLKKNGEFEGRKKEMKQVRRAWGEDGMFSSTKDDKFLRNYILNRGWVDEDDGLDGSDPEDLTNPHNNSKPPISPTQY